MQVTKIPASFHSDLTARYGSLATLTSAYFVYSGIVHRAVRFYRSDLIGTGKIEIYTCPPGESWGEELFKYADEFKPSRLDVLAIAAILAASPGTYVPTHAFQAIERANGIEL